MFVFSLYYFNMVVNIAVSMAVIHHHMGIRGGTTFQKNSFCFGAGSTPAIPTNSVTAYMSLKTVWGGRVDEHCIKRYLQ
jgi:hypothetical protein